MSYPQATLWLQFFVLRVRRQVEQEVRACGRWVEAEGVVGEGTRQEDLRDSL